MGLRQGLRLKGDPQPPGRPNRQEQNQGAFDQAQGTAPQGIEAMEQRQLHDKVHGPHQHVQHQQQRQERQDEQNAVGNGAHHALHHRGDDGSTGVPDLFLRLLRQRAPHILIQAQQDQQVLYPGLLSDLFRGAVGLDRHGFLHPASNVLLDDGRGQPGRRVREGCGDHSRAHQGHDHHDKSGQGTDQALPGTPNGKGQQNHHHDGIYYNSCCHDCLPFRL